MSDFNLNTLIPLIEETINYPNSSSYSPVGRSSSGLGTILFGLITTLRSKNILETGTASGGSAYPLLLGAYLTQGVVTSVDNGTFPVNRHWINNIPIENISKHAKYVESDAIEFLKNSKEVYDFIFIDDWHEYNHVLTELEYAKDLISPNGVIAMHDAMYGNYEPKYRMDLNPGGEFGSGGVYKAVKDFVAKYPDEWEFCTIPADHGLTILRKIQN